MQEKYLHMELIKDNISAARTLNANHRGPVDTPSWSVSYSKLPYWDDNGQTDTGTYPDIDGKDWQRSNIHLTHLFTLWLLLETTVDNLIQLN